MTPTQQDPSFGAEGQQWSVKPICAKQCVSEAECACMDAASRGAVKTVTPTQPSQAIEAAERKKFEAAFASIHGKKPVIWEGEYKFSDEQWRLWKIARAELARQQEVAPEMIALPVVAWMTDDGRVATSSTKLCMPNASKASFSDPLVRYADAEAALAPRPSAPKP